MHTTRNDRLLTLSLAAFAIGMGVHLFCEHVQQVPIVPLRDGRVIVRNGVVIIENARSVHTPSTLSW